MLHAYGELNRAKVRVAAGTEPWLSGWNRLTATAHGDTAVRILNAWSATLTTLTGNADRFLAAGLYGYQFANAAELMCGYSGFDLGRFRGDDAQRLLPAQQPVPQRTQRRLHHQLLGQLGPVHHERDPGLRDPVRRRREVRPGGEQLQERAGNGSLRHAVPFVYDNVDGYALGQWQESGRDQGHTMMGMGQMGAWAIAESVRPEGGGGDHGSTSGGFDQTGFGTLLYAT